MSLLTSAVLTCQALPLTNLWVGLGPNAHLTKSCGTTATAIQRHVLASPISAVSGGVTIVRLYR